MVRSTSRTQKTSTKTGQSFDYDPSTDQRLSTLEKFKEGRYRNKLRLRSRSVPRLLEDRREDRSEDEVTLRNEMNNLYDVDFGAKTKKDLVKVKRYSKKYWKIISLI